MAQPRLADYGMLLFLGVTWGSSFVLIGVALPTIPPITITAIRCLLAALALLAAARMLGHAIPRGGRVWLSFLAMGLTNSALPFILIAGGQTRIDSSLAAILIATVPLFTLVLAHFFAGDRSTPKRVAGVAIGFGGIVLLIGPSALAGIGADLLGQIMVVGGALCFAITQVLVKRHRGGAPVVGAACSIACSALWTIPLALLVEQPWRGAAPGAGAVAAVLVLGLLSTGFTHFVFFLLLQRTGPQFVTLNNYIAPSVGLVLGIVFLGENPHWTAYVALPVIIAGIFVATRAPRRVPAPAAAEAR
jgi:drug/metabolite transporter (DMT)-like permease